MIFGLFQFFGDRGGDMFLLDGQNAKILKTAKTQKLKNLKIQHFNSSIIDFLTFKSLRFRDFVIFSFCILAQAGRTLELLEI